MSMRQAARGRRSRRACALTVACGGPQDSDTGQLLLSGMGELHLDIIRDRLGREFGLDVRLSRMQVAYRETVSREVFTEVQVARTRWLLSACGLSVVLHGAPCAACGGAANQRSTNLCKDGGAGGARGGPCPAGRGG